LVTLPCPRATLKEPASTYIHSTQVNRVETDAAKIYKSVKFLSNASKKSESGFKTFPTF
jgi:hypothetical protein